MSRIHEALKRAEQERASREKTEPPVQQSASALELSLPPVAGPTDSAKELPPLTTSEQPELPTSPFLAKDLNPDLVSLEGMLARCRKPDWTPNGATTLFTKGEDHQYKAEVFRTLRSRLYRIRDQMSLRTLLITSSLPDEGKTYIAANLGQAFAQQHGRRVLLVDADLRVAGLHRILGAPQAPGLSEYLLGETDEFSVIQRGPNSGLFFLPCGRLVTNPVELIANGRMKELLERLRPMFDWIILDSPPMTPVSDASLLADMCDGALLVVRAASTPFDLAQKACAEFKNAPLVGVVLNGAERHGGYGYYYSKSEKTNS